MTHQLYFLPNYSVTQNEKYSMWLSPYVIIHETTDWYTLVSDEFALSNI